MAQHIARYKSQAAVHALGERAEGMLAPLLEKDEHSIASSDESSEYSAASTVESVKVKPTATQMMKTAAVGIALLVGATASAGSIILSPAIAVFVMAGVAIAHAPYAAYKEVRIIKLPALRNLNNKLRQDANELEEEVDILKEEIGLLEPEAERAAGVEEELREITEEQGTNVNRLVDLVRENESILNEMRDNLRQRIVQDIFKIVIMSDKNNDGRFCRVETKMLVLKISLQLQEYGVEFDESKFYKVMAKDPTVAQTLEIVRRIVPQLNEDKDSDNDEDEHDLYDMFHMAPSSSIPGSLSSVPSGGSTKRRMSLAIKPQRGKSQDYDTPTSDRSALADLKEAGDDDEVEGSSGRIAPVEGKDTPISEAMRGLTLNRIFHGEKGGHRDRLKKVLNTPVREWHDLSNDDVDV